MLDGERDRIFNDWLANHKGILFKVVHAYAFEHADRQDLFQEIVMQVWRSVEAFRGESSVSTWVYRVALNTATAWTRKQDRHQRGKQPLETVDGLLAASATEADPRVEWLYRQIAQLKDVDRAVALLMLDGFAYKEIAADADVPLADADDAMRGEHDAGGRSGDIESLSSHTTTLRIGGGSHRLDTERSS